MEAAQSKPGVSRGPTACARVAIAGTIFFFLVMYVAFPFIQPELSLLYRFGSEYAVGRMGWLMNAAFFVWSTALLAFAIALSTGLDRAARSRVAVVLFVIAAAGIFTAGVFESDLQVLNENPPPRWVKPPPSEEQMRHGVAGLVAFISVMSGMGFTTHRLRRAGRLRERYLWLRPLAWAVPLAFVVMVVLIEVGLAGLGQRIFLLVIFSWLLLAAHGLQSRALMTRS